MGFKDKIISIFRYQKVLKNNNFIISSLTDSMRLFKLIEIFF